MKWVSLLKKKKKFSLFLPAFQDAEGKEGGPGSRYSEEAGGQEGGQPPFREKIQEFWHWTGYPTQKGPQLLRQMAPLHPAAAAKGYSLKAAESASCN